MSTPVTDWAEQQRRAREQRGLRSAGPCLVCDEQTAYGSYSPHGLYDRYGNMWLDRQFKPGLRAGHIAAIEEGIDIGRARSALLGQFVCDACLQRLKELWPERAKERKVRWERELVEARTQEQERRFRRTWRMPNPGEFTVSSGRQEFLVRSLDQAKFVLTFRWRTCLSQKCVGNVPAQYVGLWVKGRLTAHYYGWQFGDGEDDDLQGDLFAPGIAFWLQHTFQRSLAKVEPDAVWRARPRPVCRRTHEGWAGLDTLHICNYGQGNEYPEPCVIQTIWPTGAVYAQLRNFQTTQQITEFAWEKLGVDVRERPSKC